MSFNTTALKIHALKTVSRFPRLMLLAQRFRYFLMRGPLQRGFVYYFRRSSKTKPTVLLRPSSIFPPIDVEKSVDEINSQGYSMCLRLPPEILDEILAYRDGEASLNIHHPHKKCEAVSRIAGDPQIISIARGYFRSEPNFYGSRLYFTPARLPADGTVPPKYENAKLVHFDCADFMDLTVFFYLDTVDADTSPHVIYPGTHKGKTLKDFLRTRYTIKEADKKFNADFVTLTGEAGIGFLEDTGTFHMQSVGKKGRWVLSLCYTLHRRAELARYQEKF